MTQQEVFERVRPVLPRLREMGVLELRLFGSTVRGEASQSSDIDFLVTLNSADFGLYCAVLDVLENAVTAKVDLIMVEALKPSMRESVLREALLVA